MAKVQKGRGRFILSTVQLTIVSKPKSAPGAQEQSQASNANVIYLEAKRQKHGWNGSFAFHSRHRLDFEQFRR